MFNSLAQLSDFLDFACRDTRPSALSQRELLARSLPLRFQAAAVLMPFDWQDGQAQVWLTRRSAQLRQHGGQIAFPGGKCDAEDGGSATATALRETEEELGIGQHNWQIIGQLRDCYLPSGFVVSPVVALRRAPLPWQPNPQEVAAVFAVPLSKVLAQQAYQARQVQYQEHDLTVYSLPFEEHDIWGATAGMLYHLAQTYPHWLASRQSVESRK